MLGFLTSKTINRVIVPGLLFWRREKRALLRRWRRAMLLPETVLLAGLILFGSYASDHFGFHPGQRALASASTVIQDGVPGQGQKRKQRALRERLHDHPEYLLHLSGADVIDAFNFVDLQRGDGAMTILQFRGTQCVLDVFLDERSEAVHYEFRSRQQAHDEVRSRDCVEDIMKARRI